MADDPSLPDSTAVPDATLDSNAPSLRVVHAVADAEGVDPVELDPLFEVFDPSALDRLFEPTAGRPGARRGTVAFEYHGYDVVVDADGGVSLD